MNGLYCLKTGFTSNDRNNVRKTFILNAYTLYFYLRKGKRCKHISVITDNAVVDNTKKIQKFILLKTWFLTPLLIKKISARTSLTSRCSLYLLPLPFW